MSGTEKPDQRPRSSRIAYVACVAITVLGAFALELYHAGAIIDFMLAKAWKFYDDAGGSAAGGTAFAMAIMVQIALLLALHAVALLIALLIALALIDDHPGAKTAHVLPVPPDTSSTPSG